MMSVIGSSAASYVDTKRVFKCIKHVLNFTGIETVGTVIKQREDALQQATAGVVFAAYR
jgi:hypothetical protein